MITAKSDNEDRLLSILQENFQILRGSPQPLGSSILREGINFAILSKHATSVTLVIFLPDEHESIIEFPLDPRYNKTGDIWHILVKGLDSGIRYGYRVDKQPNYQTHIHRFDPDIVLMDPYAKAFAGASTWGKIHNRKGTTDPHPRKNMRRSLVVDPGFDWGFDQPLNTPLSETIIYEAHIRGFTKHPSSGVAAPGTFKGLIEKIPYLQKLGVTAIELMPINEFEEMEVDRINPYTGKPLINYWGYNSIGFFAPKEAFAQNNDNGGAVNEFRSMVKALHQAGIEVILDIVFNHSGEGDERGQTYSFRGLDNTIYYIIDPLTGKYHNYSGCGNTLNCNHPVVRDMIIDCLNYWVTEMHVDGFRFDLASILGRGQDGSVLSNPPLLERIAYDPILAKTKLIAEAWDAAGLYQVGSFPAWGRWAEWNGKFRDDVRKFLRGDLGMVPALATRMAGSSDLYQGSGRAPCHSINFVTSHDGFTLNDLVSYNRKHNQANGENNCDGQEENFSCNWGQEGPTDSPQINELRMRNMKNFAAILLLSHGVPMILGGDEWGRTQKGNNNAYCQDNQISWLNWDPSHQSRELLRFFSLLIQFRKTHRSLRPSHFADTDCHKTPIFTWHGIKNRQPDWSYYSRSLALQLHNCQDSNDIFIIANAYNENLSFEIPPLLGDRQWRRVLDTFLPSPKDILPPGSEEQLPDQTCYNANAHSIVVLVSK